MTKFEDGPAAGVTLMLRRLPMPIFLRVVVNRYGEKKTWDALDKLDDEPAAGEDIYVYRKASSQGSVHLCMRGGRGGTFEQCTYRFVEPQPDNHTLRNQKEWQEWCQGIVDAEADEDLRNP